MGISYNLSSLNAGANNGRRKVESVPSDPALRTNQRGSYMERKASYRIAVLGATGAVGRRMVETLERRNFPIESLKLLASERSAGQTIAFRGEQLPVERATADSFEGIDIALFSAGATTSQIFAPEAVKRGQLSSTTVPHIGWIRTCRWSSRRSTRTRWTTTRALSQTPIARRFN